MSALATSELRKAAEPAFEDGICSLIRAFNMTNDPANSWAFPAAHQKRVKTLIDDLFELFFNGEIKAHPGAEAFARAHGDNDFQRFMFQTVTKPRRKRNAKAEAGEGHHG